MFQMQDTVMVRNSGICVIEALDAQTMVLRPVRHPQKELRLPVSAASDRVRRLMSREEAEELLDRIPYIRTIQAPNDKVRMEFYQEAMEKNAGLEWIQVIKSVYLRKQERRLSAEELSLYERAKEYAYSELAAVLEIPLEQVEDYICQHVANSF